MRGKKRFFQKAIIVSIAGLSAAFLLGLGSVVKAGENGEAERVTLGTTNVEGKLVRATEMGEGYF
ncbi:MAG TPA: hypothetical protein VLB09_08445, partial [Nitrospiria bacterium]|nr:hypothetical protein [Nitrospiria bacterium]